MKRIALDAVLFCCSWRSAAAVPDPSAITTAWGAGRVAAPFLFPVVPQCRILRLPLLLLRRRRANHPAAKPKANTTPLQASNVISDT